MEKYCDIDLSELGPTSTIEKNIVKAKKLEEFLNVTFKKLKKLKQTRQAEEERG